MNNLNQIEFIQNNLGKYSLRTISRISGIAPKTLEMTLHRKIGTSNTKEYTGSLTAGELAKIIKVDRNTVINWIKRHGLLSKQMVTRFEKRFTFIKTEDFWEWAFQNKDKVDFSNIEFNSLPIEPLWVNEERKVKKERMKKRAWTIKEELELISLVDSGKSYKELARLFNRTQYALEKKYYRIKEKMSYEKKSQH